MQFCKKPFLPEQALGSEEPAQSAGSVASEGVEELVPRGEDGRGIRRKLKASED
ncbi:MAG: hypothetical protein ACOC8Y_06195 [Candidatus Natronoplasma sp.]